MRTGYLFVVPVLATAVALAAFGAAPKAAAPERKEPMTKRAGVTILERDKCDDAYRLYSSRNSEVAHLIDIDGREVHRWSYPQGKTWHYAHMLPNGNLVAIVKDVMILELDWHGKLVWKKQTRAHHDFARLAGGNTLVVSRRKHTDAYVSPGRQLSYDTILEVTPQGKTVWEWKVEQHARELAKLVDLQIPSWKGFGDWPLINTGEVLPDGPTAKRDKRCRAGNIMIGGRHIDTIAVIDRKTGKIVWAWGPGEILGPHMPTMLPSGNILIYDNGQNASTKVRRYTRIIELDPIAGKIVWQYKADPPGDFYSPSRGSNERLANGNTFIAESDSGRLFEVTPRGRIVWELLNPDTNKRGRRIALYRALAYERDLVDKLLKKHAQDKKQTK